MNKVIQVAVESAERASEVLMEYYERAEYLKAKKKKGKDFVTQADKESERVIIETIRKNFPTHLIVSEEKGVISGSAWKWYIDPLDGTHNFMHGMPEFGISIGVEYKGELVAGVIKIPVLNKLYIAEKGSGAFCNGNRIYVQERPLEKAIVGTGVPSFKEELFAEYLKLLTETYRTVLDVRKTGSAVLDLAFTAEGILDGCWEMAVKPWDISAGVLLVKEAGGSISDFVGRDRYLLTGDIVAGTQTLHAELVKRFKNSDYVKVCGKYYRQKSTGVNRFNRS